jgi:glycosyltransferase involved in cell wall biosynthesis
LRASEGDNLRKLGFRQPIAVIPCGVDTQLIAQRLQALDQVDRWSDLARRPFVLFLSRIHSIKGVELLLDVWKALIRDFPEWTLVLAGAGDPAYVEACRKRAREHGIEKHCVWAGHVSELEKSWLYAKAAFYVLPSYSENYANTVVEALAHGTPVLTTPYTPWEILTSRECGWIADTTPKALGAAMHAALKMDSARRRQMGQKGQRLVEEGYSESFTSQCLEDSYLWLLGGTRPGFVRMD